MFVNVALQHFPTHNTYDRTNQHTPKKLENTQQLNVCSVNERRRTIWGWIKAKIITNCLAGAAVNSGLYVT